MRHDQKRIISADDDSSVKVGTGYWKFIISGPAIEKFIISGPAVETHYNYNKKIAVQSIAIFFTLKLIFI